MIRPDSNSSETQNTFQNLENEQNKISHNEFVDEEQLEKDNDKYLCFMIGEKKIAIPLLSAQEVIEIPQFTEIPNAPNFIKGIINLRGEMVTVADLNILLGQNDPTKIIERKSCIIILGIESTKIGFILDEAKGVIDLKDFVKNDENISKIKTDPHIESIAKDKNGEFVFTLNFKKLLGYSNLGNV